jgi:DMSO/TMAO reductase YedYZ molybdopterin-dependent catalytic subunit
MRKDLRIAVLALGMAFSLGAAQDQEITEYNGRKLTPLAQQRWTTVESAPAVDPASYRLKIDGAVETPVALSYAEVGALPQESKVIDFKCVEGWGFTALWSGPKIEDLINLAHPSPKAKTVIFHTIGGEYTDSLPLDYVLSRKILLGSKINGLPLSPVRGFPFQVVAESKFGYKWVQWVQRIELSEKDYKGYWEKRGYSNSANIRE